GETGLLAGAGDPITPEAYELSDGAIRRVLAPRPPAVPRAELSTEPGRRRSLARSPALVSHRDERPGQDPLKEQHAVNRIEETVGEAEGPLDPQVVGRREEGPERKRDGRMQVGPRVFGEHERKLDEAPEEEHEPQV